MYRRSILDHKTRKLLHEIDENEVLKEYMRGVCHDMRGVLQKISSCVSVQYETAPANPEHYQYEQTMYMLLNLGTTRNITHPGSVNNCDVDGVLRSGNIRERCAVLMNILCHDKKHRVMLWILGHVKCAEKCERCCSLQDMHETVPWLPTTLNTQRLILYKNALGMCMAGDKMCSADEQCAKKDIRKALCRVVNCPRKNIRVPRLVAEQQLYAMHKNDAIPRLSWRELSLQHTYASNALVQLNSKWPNRRQYSTMLGGNGVLTDLPTTIPPTAKDTNVAQQNACNAYVASALQIKGATPASAGITLPWLTGHMCWQMVHTSAFFLLATRRGEDVIAGPSGHTHAMLTFMSIFRNFDVEKWTLICLVWLVGADHHSVLEVLSAASRHGLHVPTDKPSIDIARELLQKISATTKNKTQVEKDKEMAKDAAFYAFHPKTESFAKHRWA